MHCLLITLLGAMSLEWANATSAFATADKDVEMAMEEAKRKSQNGGGAAGPSSTGRNVSRRLPTGTGRTVELNLIGPAERVTAEDVDDKDMKEVAALVGEDMVKLLMNVSQRLRLLEAAVLVKHRVQSIHPLVVLALMLASRYSTLIGGSGRRTPSGHRA